MKILIFLLTTINLYAAQVAVVKTKRAIIYSDQELKSAIGFVRIGKKIKVGDVPRNNGSIYPLVISGKISYIKASDINLDYIDGDDLPEGPRNIEHDVEPSFKDTLKKLNEDNYLIIGYGKTPAGQNFDLPSRDLHESPSLNESITNIDFIFDHRPPADKYTWGVGISYNKLSSSLLEFRSLAAVGNLYYSLIKFKYATIDLFVGGLISGEYVVKNKLEGTESKGYLFGANFGGLARFFQNSDVGLNVGIASRALRGQGLQKLEVNGTTYDVSRVDGINLFASLSIEL